jgi:hypothetical protein
MRRSDGGNRRAVHHRHPSGRCSSQAQRRSRLESRAQYGHCCTAGGRSRRRGDPGQRWCRIGHCRVSESLGQRSALRIAVGHDQTYGSGRMRRRGGGNRRAVHHRHPRGWCSSQAHRRSGLEPRARYCHCGTTGGRSRRRRDSGQRWCRIGYCRVSESLGQRSALRIAVGHDHAYGSGRMRRSGSCNRRAVHHRYPCSRCASHAYRRSCQESSACYGHCRPTVDRSRVRRDGGHRRRRGRTGTQEDRACHRRNAVAVQNKQHVVSRRRDIGVRWCCDRQRSRPRGERHPHHPLIHAERVRHRAVADEYHRSDTGRIRRVCNVNWLP